MYFKGEFQFFAVQLLNGMRSQTNTQTIKVKIIKPTLLLFNCKSKNTRIYSSFHYQFKIGHHIGKKQTGFIKFIGAFNN